MKHIKALKEKLQFTGWLQYILTALLATIFILFSLIIWALINLTIAAPFLFIALVLYVIVALDIITVKFKFHLKEALPHKNDNLEIFDLMRARISCRSFQIRQMSNDDHDKIMGYVALEMNQINKDSELKDLVRFEYICKPLTVWPVVNASEFVVAIAPKEYSYKSVINVGRSLQRIVIHATRMGLATCWIGPGADQTSIIQQMGSDFDVSKDHIVCVCAVGYASKHIPFSLRLMRKSQRWRLPIDELFFKNPQLAEPLDINENTFSGFGRCYEVCQWAPSSFNSQPTRAVVESNQPGEIKIDFYCTPNSRFYGPIAIGIWCANWELGCEALHIEGDVLSLPPLSEENPVSQYGISWKGKTA